MNKIGLQFSFVLNHAGLVIQVYIFIVTAISQVTFLTDKRLKIAQKL